MFNLKGSDKSDIIHPRFYNFGEGRIIFDEPEVASELDSLPVKSQDPYIARFQYYLKDHLGNTMVIYEDRDKDLLIKPEDQEHAYDVVERFMYYPFGMKWEDVWPLDFNPEVDEENRYLYNGKELHRGSGLYDYGFRYYLAEIGRFTGVDPLAEEMPAWNPYHYVFNNPKLLIDPLGLAPELNDAKFHDPPGSNQNSSDKSHTEDLIYFKNETEGYNYLYKSANFEGDQSGVVEHFAWIMPEGGVAVLPTIGTNSLGQEFENSIGSADWKYLPYEIGDKGIQVQLKGKWQSPLASIHTHPTLEDIGFTDIAANRTFGIPGFIISRNKLMVHEPRQNLQGSFHVSELLNGKMKISKHLDHIINLIR